MNSLTSNPSAAVDMARRTMTDGAREAEGRAHTRHAPHHRRASTKRAARHRRGGYRQLTPAWWGSVFTHPAH